MNGKNSEGLPNDDIKEFYDKKLDVQNINANLNIGFKLKKLTSNTSVAYKGYDGYQLFDKKGNVKYFPEYDLTVNEDVSQTPTNISSYQNTQISQKIGYKLNDKLNFKVNARYFDMNKYDFVANNIFDKTISLTYGASILYDINAKSNLNFSFSGDRYTRYDKYELIDGKAVNYKNNYIQPRVLHNHTFNEKQVLSSGIEFFKETLFADKFSGVSDEYSEKEQWSATAFVQDDWKINEKLSFIFGVRADYHSSKLHSK